MRFYLSNCRMYNNVEAQPGGFQELPQLHSPFLLGMHSMDLVQNLLVVDWGHVGRKFWDPAEYVQSNVSHMLGL
uniref:Uncharacterized protein LOC103486956 isoform X2 n=1 Tax=Rhizophora mucronata TaxID=61149 RepID=A0A2P2MI85_RHIMU